MKTRNLILCAFALASLSSCTATTQCSDYSYSEYKTASIPAPVIYSIPQIAELDVSETRITYTERLNIRVKDYNNSQIDIVAQGEKEVVIGNAIKQHNCDVLVQPIVDIASDKDGFLVVTVSGYPATYKNFRNYTSDDEWIMKLHDTDADTKEKKQAPLVIKEK